MVLYIWKDVGMHGGKEGLLPRHLNDGKAHKFKVAACNCMWTSMLIIETIIYGSYSILVNLGKEDGQLPFKSGSVVLLIEFTKLMTSCLVFVPEFVKANYRLPRISRMVMVSFAVPAVLYTFNNNIALYMQLQMDPTTFQVLNNLKIATTALLYKLMIKRSISRPQWIALFLLTLAGVCDSYGGFEESSGSRRMFITISGLIMMLVSNVFSSLASVHTELVLKYQLPVRFGYFVTMDLDSKSVVSLGCGFFDEIIACCYGGFVDKRLEGDSVTIFITVKGLLMMLTYCCVSGFAAIYTEYLLKTQKSTSLPLQNILLYTYGTVLNWATLVWQTRTYDVGDQGFFKGFSIYTWLIVVTQASSGLIMSVVMKHGSNLTRLFIISGGMLTSTMLSVFIFGTVINIFFIIAAMLVVAAVCLYHH